MTTKNDRLQGILFNQMQVLDARSLSRIEPAFIFMQNDSLQGILFDKTQLVDLAVKAPAGKMRGGFSSLRWLSRHER